VTIQSSPKGRRAVWLAVPLVLLVLLFFRESTVRAVQQNVPFQGTIPVAPQGLAGKALPDKPVDFNTGEGQHIRVSVVAKG